MQYLPFVESSQVVNFLNESLLAGRGKKRKLLQSLKNYKNESSAKITSLDIFFKTIWSVSSLQPKPCDMHFDMNHVGISTYLKPFSLYYHINFQVSKLLANKHCAISHVRHFNKPRKRVAQLSLR